MYDRSGGRREVRVLACGKLEKKEVRDDEYERKLRSLREVRMSVRDEAIVNDVFSVFRDALMGLTAEVAGYKVLMGRRGGSAWWTDEIKEAVEESL